MITSEEFFRNKIKEKNPELRDKEFSLSRTAISGEDGLRWAHEFTDVKTSELQQQLASYEITIKNLNYQLEKLSERIAGQGIELADKEKELTSLKNKHNLFCEEFNTRANEFNKLLTEKSTQDLLLKEAMEALKISNNQLIEMGCDKNSNTVLHNSNILTKGI
ncbi:MAG: hypothetical protein V4547_18190 [Bacteroidota bacterium]